MSALPTPQDAVTASMAGERAAQRVLRRIRDRVGTGDELLGELRDVAHDDGETVSASPRLRAFCRALQKELEGRRT